MDERGEIFRMNRLQHYQQYQWWYECMMLSAFLILTALTNATSAIMEATRNGAQPTFQTWEPFVWEFSSAAVVLGLVPAVSWLLRHYPFRISTLWCSIPLYSAAILAFSIVHISLMVLLRKLAYLTQGISYHFGSIGFEFLYELRKDVMTFISIVIVFYTYRFISSRLIGEANAITEQKKHDRSEAPALDRLLVKKLGKEFIVKLDDVEWMESSGNYVNLHIQDRIYPIRKTLGKLSEEVAQKGFCRIHRSHAIHLDFVESITSFPSGDGEVTLKSGKTLNISRRYKDALKQRLI